jgi:hypothetical protein
MGKITYKSGQNRAVCSLQGKPFVIICFKKCKMMTGLSSLALSSFFLMTTSLMTVVSSPAHKK